MCRWKTATPSASRPARSRRSSPGSNRAPTSPAPLRNGCSARTDRARRFPVGIKQRPPGNSPGGLVAVQSDLLPVGHPDVLDLGGLAQEVLARALHRVAPVARVAVVDPGALHVARAGGFDHRAAL